jgi:hypothetical protein
MTQQEFFNCYKYNIRTNKIGLCSFGTVYKAERNLVQKQKKQQRKK